MNVIDAIRDENLFGPYMGDDLGSWSSWLTALKTLYGLPLDAHEGHCVGICTGRDPQQLPAEGFDTALFLTGRRSGKSRIAGLIGAYEAVLAGHETKLSPGELGMVVVVSPTRQQSNIVKTYMRAAFATPLLQGEVVGETKDGFVLANGTEINILAGDWRTVRGYTLLAAIVDETAFFGYDAEAKVKSDAELIRAIKPSLATTNGKLVAISSPYARKGWCYTTHEKNFGNDAGRVLVWNCPSKAMNPLLSQRIIDEAYEEDRASAMAEYGGQFRDDVADFLPRAVIEASVIKGRLEQMPKRGTKYQAFCDLSGGRHDDATLAVAHAEGRTVVLDLLRRYKPPFSPQDVVQRMADELRRYGVTKVEGDNYGAEFVARAFVDAGVKYTRSEMNKSELYLELMPRLCSGHIELLDDETLISQLASLERRTRSGGRDIVDHPPGGHDDVANAVAGVAAVVSLNRTKSVKFFSG
jgi:hypothetical protein